ncbi:carbonic anhydrase 1 [Anabrus simplex]|uniref:carbonic anhydrase 1 n=1 Tax=Anabrus simplex TaxID=316456 RepID=UPI0035A2AB8B
MVLTLNLIAVLGFIYLVKDGNAHRFSYKKDAQELWHNVSKHCAGRMQSPINIVSHRAMPVVHSSLEMVYYHNPLPLPLKLVNTDHSVSLQPEKGKESIHMPKIFGALLSGEYEFESLHFHWGHKNSRGSEHVMNGIRFPVEMHIIHRSTKYGNMKDALAHSNGLTVLAFFFQVQEKNNKNLEPILKAFPHVKLPHQEVTLNETFTLASLLDTDLDVFYTYRGSLTTPPCSEAVTWIVFPDPLFLSFRQIKRFRRIMSQEDKMGNNFRSPQPLYNRLVYVRKMMRSNKSEQKRIDHSAISWVS